MMRHARLRVPLPRLLSPANAPSAFARTRAHCDFDFSATRTSCPLSRETRRCRPPRLSAVEREVQREHVDARLTEYAELASFGRLRDELAHVVHLHSARARDACDLI